MDKENNDGNIQQAKPLKFLFVMGNIPDVNEVSVVMHKLDIETGKVMFKVVETACELGFSEFPVCTSAFIFAGKDLYPKGDYAAFVEKVISAFETSFNPSLDVGSVIAEDVDYKELLELRIALLSEQGKSGKSLSSENLFYELYGSNNNPRPTPQMMAKEALLMLSDDSKGAIPILA